MPNPPDVSAEIHAFLLSHPGQHCRACLTAGARLDAKAVEAAFKPSKDYAYSFISTQCPHCETTAMCVAYVGDLDPMTRRQAAKALMGSKH